VKRASIIVLSSVLLFTLAGVAFATTAGTPDVQIASATFTASPKGTPTMTTCMGVGGVTYQKVVGTWKATITDTSPIPLPFGLSGTGTIKGTLTISTALGTGNGTLTVKITGSGGVAYKGTAPVVSQVVNQQNDVQGRGFLNANITKNSNSTGYAVKANFEFAVSGTTGAIAGQFGSTAGSQATLDYSTETNNQTC